MNKIWVGISLIFLLFMISACSTFEGRNPGADQTSVIPKEEMESYTAELISGGFEFCPGTYLEISAVQNHENPQFNFLNEATATGELHLEITGTGQHTGLKTKSQLPLIGEGQAGVCQFTSSGTMDLDITGKLLPGENNQPNMLFYGQCETTVQSKPPCGDFGMIPFEKTVFVIIPYHDGGTVEWEWKNHNVGLYGKSKWILHIPCDN